MRIERYNEKAEECQPSGAAKVWRVDAAHANGRRAWERAGSPLEPDPRQWQNIRVASELRADARVRRMRGSLPLAPNSFALIEVRRG